MIGIQLSERVKFRILNNLFRYAICILTLSIFSGCASIMSPSRWQLNIDTHPAGAKVEIRNSDGILAYAGITPASAFLRGGKGFFEKESYMVKLNLEGWDEKSIPVNCVINDWYWFNILFGGFIGMAIVDPATGAMYKLDRENINVRFDPNTTKAIISDSQIFELGETVRVPHGFSTIPGKIVEVKKETVIVEYPLKGKMVRTEIDNYMVIRSQIP